MILLEEIRENFATRQEGIRRLKTLSKQYIGWTFRRKKEYGVAILFDNDSEVMEQFANVKLCNKTVFIENKPQSMLILSSTIDEYRYEFACICAQFIDPGKDGNDRKKLIENPIDWWKKWKFLMGNAIYEKQVYSVIAELVVIKNLMENNQLVQWTGADYGTHDIESATQSYEVKSTIRRYGASITISSQYQLKSDKKLSLYFCRLEKSNLGISINDIVKDLVNLGYKKEKLEQQLTKMNLKIGQSIRDEKYKILEKRRYIINEAFPKITDEMFITHKMPDAITKIEYTVDLDAIPYQQW